MEEDENLNTVDKLKQKVNELNIPIDITDYFVKRQRLNWRKYYKVGVFMSDTNLNLYKIFCIVAESKNYKEASEKLYLTESTISSHIKNLEKN